MATTRKKFERSLYGPSLMEVTLGALLSIVLGGLLAMIFLMFKPVQTVKTLPAELEPAVVYYVEGSSNSAKGRQYLRKRQLFLEGGPAEVISLSEDELNAWMASSRAKPDAAASASGLLAPQSINFRVREGVFQIGLPCTVNFVGYTRPVVVQARGGFVKKGDRFVFDPDQMHVGSLEIGKLPGLAPLMVSRLLSAQDIPEETYQAWKRLDRVAVEGDQLVLALP